MSVDLQEKRETRQAPPKCWMNWWRAPVSGRLTDGKNVSAGDALPGGILYPSKDIARTRALEALARGLAAGECWLDYIDALPEGERPQGPQA